MGKRERKVRSDKKIPIGPFVSSAVYDCFEALKYITGQSIKQLGEDFLTEGMKSSKAVGKMKMDFKNQFILNEYISYPALGTAERGYRPNVGKSPFRVQMRLNTALHDRIIDLSYALATTKSAAAGYLLVSSFMTGDILKKVVTNYVGDDMDRQRVKELKRIIKFIQTYNPHQEETSLWLLFAHQIKTGLEYLENR